jgi:chemotaxis protein CheD
MFHLHSRRLDVVLEPGQFFFGESDLRIGTLLGSCVAITMWHPRTKAGGMCHYLLPSRGEPRPGEQLPDGRYGDEALEMFMQEIERINTFREDYQVKLFGGGSQFQLDAQTGPIDVPTLNIRAGTRLLAGYGLQAQAEHVGGSGSRQVVLDLANGHVWVRHRRLVHPGVGR